MEDSTIEIWKDIKGYNNYQVSSFGRVKSKARFLSEGKRGRRFQKEKMLVLSKTKTGYVQVSLYNEKGMKLKRVHSLVADAFLPLDQKKETVDHIDNNKKNNRIDNLQWMSFCENSKKAVKDKLHVFGERNAFSKLKEKDVIHIRDEFLKPDHTERGSKEKTLRSLMKGYGMSRFAIKAIVYRWRWKHIE
jgi:hypothetical protein